MYLYSYFLVLLEVGVILAVIVMAIFLLQQSPFNDLFNENIQLYEQAIWHRRYSVFIDVATACCGMDHLLADCTICAQKSIHSANNRHYVHGVGCSCIQSSN